MALVKRAKRIAKCHPNKPHAAHGLCRQCYQALRVAAIEKVREQRNAQARRWRQKNRDHAALVRAARIYGIPVEEIIRLREVGCVLCGSRTRLHVDHDHVTNKVRGCLCGKHNTLIGFLEKHRSLLETALDYIDTGGIYGAS